MAVEGVTTTEMQLNEAGHVASGTVTPTND